MIAGCKDLGPTRKVLVPVETVPRPDIAAHLKLVGVPQAKLQKTMDRTDPVMYEELK